MSIAKAEAMELLNEIPEDATWDDIMYQFYVRKKVEAAIQLADAGKVVSHEEVKKRFRSE